jgi:hypothetical protein
LANAAKADAANANAADASAAGPAGTEGLAATEDEVRT